MFGSPTFGQIPFGSGPNSAPAAPEEGGPETGTSGIVANSGFDLDDLFKPRGGNTARANVGIKVGSQDIADRYCPTLIVGDTSPNTTGIYATIAGNPVDIHTLFRRLTY